MKKCSSVLSGFLRLAVTGCASCFGFEKTEPQLTQVSTIDALLAGNYDGVITAEKLKRCGTLGIGTVDHLDGELIVLNGAAYHVRADGKAYAVADQTLIPFASVTNFQPDNVAEIASSPDMEAFLKKIDALQPHRNIPVALRMYGKFKVMKVRSVPRQEKPYLPLAEVTKHQPEFHLHGVEGWLVGFRLPAYLKGVNVPGWHLHFLTADRTAGGHVLAFQVESGKAETAEIGDFRVILPKNSDAFQNTDFTVDRSQELHAAESDH